MKHTFGTNIRKAMAKAKQKAQHSMLALPIALALAAIAAASCARMGQPDGGWYDETPPKVVGASPADRSVNAKAKKITISFDEFVKIENASEKVVVSPPQLEMPEIKSEGKKIEVLLHDSLKPNTTYTVDFSDAISDNNEGNPLGNYTYSFSTGNAIDTFEVSGYVLQADNLEPVKGILVGLYSDLADSAFAKTPMLRVSRTDSRGHFVIKGIAPGTYRAYALQDADGNYMFNQKSEMLAFNHDTIRPSAMPDIRQDTTWLDSLRIKSIGRVGYTHFLPDDITLRAFNETLTDRYLIKNEREEANRFALYFSYGSDTLPRLRGLNFDDRDAFVIEPSQKLDTITYWLRDTALVNQDTLDIELSYMMTDTTGTLRPQTDTLQILSKQPYEKRMKQLQKEADDWKKKQQKAKRRGEPYDSVMPAKALEMAIKPQGTLDPDRNVSISFNTPVAKIDIGKIHLYAKHDTLWYKAPFELRAAGDTARADSALAEPPALRREYVLKGEWRPDIEYSLEIDSAAFTDIYGLATKPNKTGLKVKSLDEYSSIILTIAGMDATPAIVQLLDEKDTPVKEAATQGSTVQFFYVKPGKYYARLFADANRNGKWDTGDYATGRQPEDVYYYPEAIECKEKWDVNLTWNPKSTPLEMQKPVEIRKQQADKEKKVKHRNLERAQKLGIQYIPKP